MTCRICRLKDEISQTQTLRLVTSRLVSSLLYHYSMLIGNHLTYRTVACSLQLWLKLVAAESSMTNNTNMRPRVSFQETASDLEHIAPVHSSFLQLLVPKCEVYLNMTPLFFSISFTQETTVR